MENVALAPCLVQRAWGGGHTGRGAHLAHHLASSHPHVQGLHWLLLKETPPMKVASLVLPRSCPMSRLYTLVTHPKLTGSHARPS